MFHAKISPLTTNIGLLIVECRKYVTCYMGLKFDIFGKKKNPKLHRA